MLTVIGCGNPNRSDDGVGCYVARALRDSLSTAQNAVRVLDAGTAGMQVMFEARGSQSLILVDANRSDAEPGAIFEVPGAELETAYQAQYTLHDFRWQHALHAGRKLFAETFPEDVVVYLIEAGSLDYGLQLTEPVQQAAERVIAEIQGRIGSAHA